MSITSEQNPYNFKIKEPAELVVSKNGKVYYKSVYDHARKYMSNLYKTDENYRIKKKLYLYNKNLNKKIEEE